MTIHSYATPADADAYIGQFPLDSDQWFDSSSELKQKYLNRATQIIDQLPLHGVKLVADQENAFPRSVKGGGLAIAKDACCEIALSLSLGVDPEREAETAFIESEGFQRVQTSYRTGQQPLHKLYYIPSYQAWSVLLPFIDLSKSVRIERV